MSEIEDRKQKIIRDLLELAQPHIVSQDPVSAIKGRFTRDCTVPIVHWLLDEYERIYGEQVLHGGTKLPEHAQAEADLLMMLMDGLGTTAGNYLKMFFQDGLKRQLASAALVAVFAKAFESQMGIKRQER